jgi:hypothetical protein
MGRVLYVSTGFGMGLAFTKIEPDKLAILNGWLAELSRESPRELNAVDDDLLVRNEATAGSEPRFMLNELIMTLIQKQGLTEAERTRC